MVSDMLLHREKDGTQKLFRPVFYVFKINIICQQHSFVQFLAAFFKIQMQKIYPVDFFFLNKTWPSTPNQTDLYWSNRDHPPRSHLFTFPRLYCTFRTGSATLRISPALDSPVETHSPRRIPSRSPLARFSRDRTAKFVGGAFSSSIVRCSVIV